MAGTNKRTTTRAPVVLRIKLRYRDLETFVDRFATNIGTGGMFIASRRPKAPGTELRFSLMLADESRIVAGSGVVRWVREFDPEHPRRPHGMGIEFVELDDGSRDVIDRVIAYRVSQGLETDEIPLADKGAVPQHVPDELSTPLAVETGPVPIFRDTPDAPPIPGPRPRPSSTAEDALDDLLDGAVDVANAMRRARALVGNGMEAELAKLLENLPVVPMTPAPAEAETEAEAETGTEAEPEPEPEAETETETETETEAEAETETETETETEAETEAEAEIEIETEAEAEAGAGAVEAEPEIEIEAGFAGEAEDYGGSGESTDVGPEFPDDLVIDSFDDVPTRADGAFLPEAPGAIHAAGPGEIEDALAALGSNDDAGDDTRPGPGDGDSEGATDAGDGESVAYDIDTSDLVELDPADLEEMPADAEQVHDDAPAKRGFLSRVFGGGKND